MSVTSTVFAATEYLGNPVLRPLTLTEGTVSIIGALLWVDEKNDSRGEINLNTNYGFTDDLMLSLECDEINLCHQMTP